MTQKNKIDLQAARAQIDSRDSLVSLFHRVYRHMQAGTFEALAERGHAGLGVAHIRAYSQIDPEGTRIVVLAERTCTTKQFTARLVQELAKREYVTTAIDPSDRRATLVFGTEKGSQFLRDTLLGQNALDRRYAELIGAGRLKQLNSILRDLADKLPGAGLTDEPV